MYGASGDAHLRSEVSGACRGLSFVLEALWRRGHVHIYRHLRAELLCSLRELLLAMSRCEVLGRVSPWRVGWISLAVVALGREMVTRLCPSDVAARHSAALCQPPPAWRPARCGVWLLSSGRAPGAWLPWLWLRSRAGALSVYTVGPNVMGL